MKLAEALAERSDCQVRLSELQKRLGRSARVQEGEQPAENATELMAEVERLFERQLHLISAINRTNAKTVFEGKTTISDAVSYTHLMCIRDSSMPMPKPEWGTEP